MIRGTFTALITPFNGQEVDYAGIERLTEFQIENGISGILAVGTTGESPVLSWEEHNAVIEKVARECRGKCISIAGTGSNNTKEALEATKHAAGMGVDAALLVDPYYNGPSSLEIRNEYVAPIARALPDLQIIPYVIPGRTGAQLLPEDLALLYRNFPNVATVKEATGDLKNMRRTRECCGPDYTILSGDDGITLDMMRDGGIAASGVISVISNIAPKAVSDMVRAMIAGDAQKAQALNAALGPLFGLVTVKTMEKTPFGDVMFRARNPLAAKSLMAILGMPSGACRKPLGRLTRNALNVILEATRKVNRNNPEILAPIAGFFGVDIEARLNDTDLHASLCYPGYE